jgi:hypothetical protein
MELVKNGKEFKIIVDGREVGKIYKDERNWNYMYAVRIEFFDFQYGGRNKSTGVKTFKKAKEEAKTMYESLMRNK